MKTFLILFSTLMFGFVATSQTFRMDDTSNIQKDAIYTSYDVTFEFDKSDLRPESFIHLDSLVTFLIVNPSIILEIQNHQDTRGSQQYYSRCLTCNRAERIREYAIAQGVDPKRLIAKGYGDSLPIIYSKNMTEEDHQKNRRTVYKILATDYKSNP